MVISNISSILPVRISSARASRIMSCVGFLMYSLVQGFFILTVALYLGFLSCSSMDSSSSAEAFFLASVLCHLDSG